MSRSARKPPFGGRTGPPSRLMFHLESGVTSELDIIFMGISHFRGSEVDPWGNLGPISEERAKDCWQSELVQVGHTHWTC